MPPTNLNALWSVGVQAGLQPGFSLRDARGHVALGALDRATALGIGLDQVRGLTVIIYTDRQISAALAVIELDGVAGRIVLCPPDLSMAQLPSVIANAKADILLCDDPKRLEQISGIRVAACGAPMTRIERRQPDRNTEWLLFTSGTTGNPKMVVHTLQSLMGQSQTGALASGRGDALPRWSTFYDIRRYGGLQILLRALVGGAPMALSEADEPIGAFLTRLGNFGVTHISGTPSHWRRALMSPAIHRISPVYVRLSGEIADQTILNNLQNAFPEAKVAHAFASTEAGVAFDVGDGLAGFPAAWAAPGGHAVEMRVVDETLRIRSARVAGGYAGEATRQLLDDDGFTDTGDTVSLREGRYYFTGRREGVINVGGLKVHPEEVEAVVNLHPNVRMSRVKARKSPITGAIVVADIVLENPGGAGPSWSQISDEILTTCRRMLPAHKVPAFVREVPALEINAAGKLLRLHA
jgi:acyl-CoA synthetase (AMP-forming)/AMP-acid ligase II